MFSLHRRSAVTQIKYSEQSRSAVCADRNTKRRNIDAADIRVLFKKHVPDCFGVFQAIGMKYVDIHTCGINAGKIGKYTFGNGIKSCFSASYLLYYIKRSAVRYIQHRLDIKYRADKCGRIRNSSAGFKVIQVVYRESVGDL